MNMTKPMSVVLIEDEVAECIQFKDCANNRSDIKFVGMTDSAEEGLKLVQSHLPEAVILDLQLSKGSGSGIGFLEALNEMDVHIGMKRSRLECDQIETYLRKKYDNLSWVSAEEVGSRLMIKVKEGTKTITSEKKEEPHHIIANVDGEVDSIVTALGTPKVRKGDKVKRGDVLISGFVKMTDDSNEVVGRTAVPASGSVIVAAEVPFEKKITKSYQKKVTAGSTKTIYDIDLFGLAFSLKNPLKHLDKSYKYDIITTVCVNLLKALIFRSPFIKKNVHRMNT